MLATVMNALVLEAAIERAGVSARTMSALTMPQVCETYERQRALVASGSELTDVVDALAAEFAEDRFVCPGEAVHGRA